MITGKKKNKVFISKLLTEDHPDSKPYPSAPVQLHHEVNVDEHADDGNEGQKRNLPSHRQKEPISAVADSSHVYLCGRISNLKGEFSLALRLPPYDKDQQETHHEDDGESYDVPHSAPPLHR